MNKLYFLGLIIMFQMVRAMIMKIKGQDGKHLWVSFFIICVPFAFEKLIEDFDPNLHSGTLGSAFKVTIPIVLLFVMLPLVNWQRIKLPARTDKWIWITLALICLSLLNPFNDSVKSSFYFAVFFLSHILLFSIFNNVLDKKQLLKGFFDGLFILCVIQLILAICFPLLGIKSVTYLFHDAAGDWATRLGSNRVGAVGVFNHPGNLSLFLVIASCFFLATYLTNYQKKISSGILIANAFTIVLTYSRTSYLTFVVILFALYYVYKNADKNIISLSVFLRFVLPASVALIWLVYFSPFSDQFLKSDTTDQYDNRLVHYFLALSIFKESPIIGVGLNAHLAFLALHPSVASAITFTDFFLVNPIHNIHLIILAETGVIGFALWLLFIFKNVLDSKKDIARNSNQILSTTFIGIILVYCLYGMTGWAPFSASLLPFLLFVSFFSIKHSAFNR
jgi:O-antigen ligase